MDLAALKALRPRVEEFRLKHKTGVLALVLTDVVGSTRMKAQLGDAHVSFLKHHREIIEEILRSFPDGEKIETAGDSFFIVFTKPSDALRFALLIQAVMRIFAAEIEYPFGLRIGIHLGSVVIEEHQGPGKAKDLYGINIDLCARVQSLGKADQVLLSRSAFDDARRALKWEELTGVGPLTWLNHGPYLMKGLDDDVEEALDVCEVGETGLAVLQAPEDAEKAWRAPQDGQLVLGWRPAPAQPVPGTSWVLEEKLGDGGFGEVWVGRDTVLKTRHVFKFCFRADRVRSLKREVAIFRLLRDNVGKHKNIVEVERTYFDEPPFYLVMPYAEGKDLAAWCQSHGGPAQVSLAVRLEIVAQVADALQAAHDSGVLHRDVKPTNILVSGGGADPATVHVRLTDFGIGQTPLYMAPEVVAGKPATAHSDIYSLGVVLYELLAGDFELPVTADWPRRVKDPLLREDLEQCFAGEPEERFSGAAQLAGTLRQWEERKQQREVENAEREAVERAAYRRGVIRTAALALVVVAVIAGLAAMFWSEKKKAETSETKVLEQATEQERQLTEASWAAFNQADRLFAEADAAKRESAEGDAAWTRKSREGLLELARAIDFNPRNRAAMERFGWETTFRREAFRQFPATFDHNGPVLHAEFSADGSRVVTASMDNTAKLWDAATGKVLATLEHKDRVNHAKFSTDGSRVVTASMDNTAKVWDAATGKVLATLEHAQRVTHAEFNSDGSRVVTASMDNTAKVWDVTTGKVLATLEHAQKVTHAEFNSDGSRVVTASMDNTAKVWDVTTGHVMATLKHAGPVCHAAFSLNRSHVVTSSWDKTAKLWSLETGQALATIEHEDEVWHAAFSPDGSRVVTASLDQTAKMWSVETGQALPTLEHNDKVRHAAFSADGRRVVTASGNTATLWDATTGKALSTLQHKDKVLHAEFSPDGNHVVTASLDQAAKVWDAAAGKLLAALAQARVMHPRSARTEAA